MKLLVIEDESLIAFELSDLLEDLGHQVVGMAAAPDRALQLIHEHGERIDAAMVDANLGGTSSRPVIEALNTAGIPVIVTSGYDRDELQQMGVSTVHVEKPYSRDEIRQTLDMLNGEAEKR